jgi:hypothetical protein
MSIDLRVVAVWIGALCGIWANCKSFLLALRRRAACVPSRSRRITIDCTMTLKVESAAGTLRIRVRPRINWLILFSTLLVLFIICGAGLSPAWARLESTQHAGGNIGGPILSLLVLSAMAIGTIYAIANMLFSSELVVLNQTTLEIQRSLLSINLSDRSFPNSTIENLRYDEWSGGRAGMQNGVRFECVGETITFARQATHSDSWDLIDKMLEIYKFPMQDSTDTERSPAVTNW